MGAEQDISFLSLTCPLVDIRNTLDFDVSGLFSVRHGLELNSDFLVFNEFVF